MKIAVIGGGSSYTPELMDGLIDRAAGLGLSRVSLHDVDGRRLELVAGFVRRMAAAKGSGLELETTLELGRAVAGAAFVVAQIRVGGNAARQKDERLGARHGLIGQETTGIGGFAKALRTVPAMLQICAELERSAPAAFLINFTNPSGLVTEAVLKHSRVRAIGLCNIPISFRFELAQALGIDARELELDYVGLNHLAWVRGVRVKGQDLMPRVLALAQSGARPPNLHELDYPPAFLRALGMVPMHYLRYYYLTGRMLEEQGRSVKTRADEVLEIEAELLKTYADPRADRKPEALARRGGANYSRAALELIESIHRDRGDVQIVNVMNRGAVPGLAADAVVEGPCRVTARGAEPLAQAEPPPAIMGLIQAVKAYERLTIEAAVSRDYGPALLALVAHPLGPAADRAEAALDDLIEVHRLDLRKA